MSTEQINAVEEVKDVVIETVPQTSPVVETAETVQEVAEEKEKKTKSFFSIFKKDEPEEVVEAPAADAADATEAVEAEAAAVEGEAEAGTEEVPVETSPAKKGRLCGLCAFGKKSEAAPAEEAAVTEEAAAIEEVVAAEEVAHAEEVVAAEEVAHAEEVTSATFAAVVADEAAAETTEGEVIAPVADAEVIRSGVLFKSGKFFKTNMNERHCRLLSTGIFQWSKTEDFTKAHECKVDSETSTVAFMAEGEEAAHKYRFELHCCGSVATYAVDTEEDRDEWIRAFETVKESVVPAAETVAETSVEAPVADAPAE
jgi:hypothetical protein